MQKTSLIRKILYLGLVLTLASVLLGINLNKEFIGHHDWNSVVYSLIAKNYIRYGYISTKLGQVRNPEITQPANFNFLIHYPPLLPILISLGFKVFGPVEFAARLIPVAASLLLLSMIFLIGISLVSVSVGFLAALFVVLTPLFIYFGKLPVHDTIVPAFGVTAFYGYIQYMKTRKKIYYMLILFGVVVGGLVNWSNYYVVLAIIVHFLVWDRNKSVRYPIIVLVPICIFLFSLQLLHLKILTGNFHLFDFIGIFLRRANIVANDPIYSFSLSTYFYKESEYLKIYMTRTLLVLSTVWLITSFFGKKSSSEKRTNFYLYALLIYGLVQLVVFTNLSYIHDYMIYYLLPYIVLSGALGFLFILKKLPFKNLAYMYVVIVVLTVGMERKSFAKALLLSDMNKKGKDIAVFIKNHTDVGENSYITSISYKEFYEVFIAFYSERGVGYGEALTPTILQNYQFIIRPKAHDALLSSDKFFLDAHLTRFENEEYIWYTKK